MTIEQYIMQRAEEKYPFHKNEKDKAGFTLSEYESFLENENYRRIFSAGASAMIEVMEGLLEYVVNSDEGSNWLGNYMTTKELLESYFSTLKK